MVVAAPRMRGAGGAEAARGQVRGGAARGRPRSPGGALRGSEGLAAMEGPGEALRKGGEINALALAVPGAGGAVWSRDGAGPGVGERVRSQGRALGQAQGGAGRRSLSARGRARCVGAPLWYRGWGSEPRGPCLLRVLGDPVM